MKSRAKEELRAHQPELPGGLASAHAPDREGVANDLSCLSGRLRHRARAYRIADTAWAALDRWREITLHDGFSEIGLAVAIERGVIEMISREVGDVHFVGKDGRIGVAPLWPTLRFRSGLARYVDESSLGEHDAGNMSSPGRCCA